MEPLQVSQSWVNYLLGALMAACGVIVRIYKNKVDRLEKSQAVVRANYVTREQLAAALSSLEARVDSRHAENTANFRELRMRLDQLNDSLLRAATK